MRACEHSSAAVRDRRDSALAPGLLAGVGAAVLPGVIARGERPSAARLAIGGSLTLAGVAAFVSRRPGQGIPENVAHNAVVRAWRREDAEVARRNAERATGRSACTSTRR